MKTKLRTRRTLAPADPNRPRGFAGLTWQPHPDAWRRYLEARAPLDPPSAAGQQRRPAGEGS